jgi:endonuclease YncB( thermonuclease family)
MFVTAFAIVVAIIALYKMKGAPHEHLTGNIYVVDGDTIDCNGTRIRLKGIDAPEKSQKGGTLATKALKFCIEGQNITIKATGVDIYGRRVATVFANGEDVCAGMVSEGYALANGAYKLQELNARRTQKGLWATGGISSPKAHRATHS